MLIPLLIAQLLPRPKFLLYGRAVEHLPAEIRGDLQVPADAYPVPQETPSSPKAQRWMEQA